MALRVIFSTSPKAFSDVGGGEIQMLETKRWLEKRGCVVSILGEEPFLRLSEFNVFHNFSIHRDTFPFVVRAKRCGLPVAISPIYWPWLRYALHWGSSFFGKLGLVGVELVNRFDVFGFSSVRKMLSLADVLLPNSVAEAMQLMRVFGVGAEKIVVVHNGVDLRFRGSSPKPFERAFGLKDFVLFVGRIEERKNVLGLIRAFNLIRCDVPLVIIGSCGKNLNYFRKCKGVAGNVLFLPKFPHGSGMLESAYAACKVFCLPSWYETPGLAALEAGLAGANVVVTCEGSAREYFGERALYVKPWSVADIAEKIALALEGPRNKALSKHIERNFSWERTALETVLAYERILHG